MMRHVAVTLSLVFLSQALWAEDACKSFRGPVSRTLEELEEVELEDLQHDPSALFWLPRELIFSGEGRQIVTLSQSFRIFCGRSFEHFQEEGLKDELEVVGNLIIIEKLSPEEVSKIHLPAGFYKPEFEKIQLDESPSEIIFKIHSADSSFRLRLLVSSPERKEFLSLFWDRQPIFVKEAESFETIEVLSLDMDPNSSGSLGTFLDAASERHGTDFEKFMREDFVIQSSGFDRWGYYKEVTKPLEGGGSIQFRFRRYDGFACDPYFRRPYWYYWP